MTVGMKAMVLRGFGPSISALHPLPTLRGMTEDLPTHTSGDQFRRPPADQIVRASGVSEVEIYGPTLRCLVCGSFHPFLEASRGHEVISLKSTRSPSPVEGGQR
jgi:hypothetical protein